MTRKEELIKEIEESKRIFYDGLDKKQIKKADKDIYLGLQRRGIDIKILEAELRGIQETEKRSGK